MYIVRAQQYHGFFVEYEKEGILLIALGRLLVSFGSDAARRAYGENHRDEQRRESRSYKRQIERIYQIRKAYRVRRREATP